MAMQDIISELIWRGLIHQTTELTPQMAVWLNDKSRTVYAGFDPTADSLHVGSLLPLLMLRRFQRAGHRPIALIGGATGMIGDPSGKSEERNLLTNEQLRRNMDGMLPQLRQFLDFDAGANSAILVNNFDWIGPFTYLEFLRDIGKHFPVNMMLAKDSVKGRIDRDSGISYTEFSYMLVMAYDFVYLQQKYDCLLQVGGSDQWGNITAGIDLGRRMHGVQLYGLTNPLLTKSDGGKMGKTESGTVWLSAARTSPYQFYQYWINVDDADAGKCLRFLTELTQEEVESLDAARAADPGRRESQRRLAGELTKLVHGDSGLSAAKRATEIFFGAEISELNDQQLSQIFADVPSRELPRARLTGDGLPLIDAFVESGLAKSKGDARRTIQQGGAYVNNRRLGEPEARLTAAHLASETVMVLRSGKKSYALLHFTG
jgi:tyrosyl-tRNA synthetase